MVDIVRLGSTEVDGYEVLAFIDADGVAYPLLVRDPADREAILADFEDVVTLSPSSEYDCIRIMGMQNGELIPANPQLLPIMKAAEYPFDSFGIGLALKTTGGVTLTEYFSSQCQELDEGNYYIESWLTEDDEYSCTFVNPLNQDAGLACDKTAFNLPAPDYTTIAACINNSPYDDTDDWLWENMAAYWLEASGVDESVIPRRS